MTYLDFTNKSKELNNKVNFLDDKINSFNWKNDSVRMSSEFQLIKLQFDQAFKNLQDFNKNSSKAHKKQRNIELKAKRLN